MSMSDEEHDYNAGLAAEAEAEYEAAAAYQHHLDEIIQQGDYDLWAMYKALDILQTKAFEKSGLSAVDYFKAKIKERENPPINELPDEMIAAEPIQTQTDFWDDLPF